jgi:hypothetical protein
MTYQPGVTVIAQGRKRVDLGRTTFICDDSRFLLTSVDLPLISRVIEASEEVPCLALVQTGNARGPRASRRRGDSGR